MTEEICKRCGKCCFLRHKGEERKCKHLIYLPSGRAVCRIYKQRLGKYLGSVKGKKFYCVGRVKMKENFDGCHYNLPMEELIK